MATPRRSGSSLFNQSALNQSGAGTSRLFDRYEGLRSGSARHHLDLSVLSCPVCLRPCVHSSRDASTAYIKQAPGRLVQKRQAEPASDSAFAPPKESYSLRSSEAPAASKVVPAATSVSSIRLPTACFDLADWSYVRGSCPTCPDGAKTRTPRSTVLQVWRFHIVRVVALFCWTRNVLKCLRAPPGRREPKVCCTGGGGRLDEPAGHVRADRAPEEECRPV